MIKLTELTKDSGWSRPKINEMVEKLGIKPKMVGRAKALTTQEAQRVLKELELPEELAIRTARARILHDANNKRYVFCKVEGYEGKRAVLLPARVRNRRPGTMITVEIAEDEKGVSFRHEWFMKVQNGR